MKLDIFITKTLASETDLPDVLALCANAIEELSRNGFEMQIVKSDDLVEEACPVTAYQ